MSRENEKKTIFKKIMAENSPKLMQTRHLGIQKEENLKQYVFKSPPFTDIRKKLQKNTTHYLPRVGVTAVLPLPQKRQDNGIVLKKVTENTCPSGVIQQQSEIEKFSSKQSILPTDPSRGTSPGSSFGKGNEPRRTEMQEGV